MVGFSIQFNGKTNHKLLVYGYGKFEWAYTPNGNMGVGTGFSTISCNLKTQDCYGWLARENWRMCRLIEWRSSCKCRFSSHYCENQPDNP